MSDGIREELQALLFDSAPPADVDGEALFARTFASDEGAGADLLPPDGLFDLPADDPADAAGLDGTGFDGAGLDGAAFGDDALLADGVSAGGEGAAPDTAGDDPGDDAWGHPADDPADDDLAGDAPEVPFEPGAGW